MDHRHHALDAIIIACTKQNHIQYLNNLNQINSADQEDENEKKQKYDWLKNEICENNDSKKFFSPWNKDKFVCQVKIELEKVIISHKNVRLLISPTNIGIEMLLLIKKQLHYEVNYIKRPFMLNEIILIMKKLELMI